MAKAPPQSGQILISSRLPISKRFHNDLIRALEALKLNCCDDRFLRDDDDEEEDRLSYDEAVALKYYRSLFKEFAVCDLKHYKSGNVCLFLESLLTHTLTSLAYLIDRTQVENRGRSDIWRRPIQLR